ADASVELLVPLHVRAEADRHAARDDGDGAAERVALLLDAVDERHHPGLAGAVDGAQRRLVVDLQQVLPRRRRPLGADGPQRAHAATDLHLVLLDLHAAAAAMAVLAPPQLAGEEIEVDAQPRRHAFQDGGEAGAVALAGSGEAQAAHGAHDIAGRAGTVRAPRL